MIQSGFISLTVYCPGTEPTSPTADWFRQKNSADKAPQETMSLPLFQNEFTKQEPVTVTKQTDISKGPHLSHYSP